MSDIDWFDPLDTRLVLYSGEYSNIQVKLSWSLFLFEQIFGQLTVYSLTDWPHWAKVIIAFDKAGILCLSFNGFCLFVMFTTEIESVQQTSDLFMRAVLLSGQYERTHTRQHTASFRLLCFR